MSKSTTRKPAAVVEITPARTPFHYEWDAKVVNVEPDMDREDPGYDEDLFATPLRSAAELNKIVVSRDEDGTIALIAEQVFDELVANGKAPRSGMDIPARFQDQADAAIAILDLYGREGIISRMEYPIERAAASYALRVPGIRDDIALQVTKERYMDICTGKVKHLPPITTVHWDLHQQSDDGDFYMSSIHPLVYFINVPSNSPAFEKGKCAAVLYQTTQTYPDKVTGELKMSYYDPNGFAGIIRFFDNISAAKEAATELRGAIRTLNRITDTTIAENSQYRNDPVRNAVQQDLKPAYQQAPSEEAF